MRFTILASLAMASVAVGQSLSDFPSCAVTCLADAIKQSTRCALTDVSCICGKFDVIQGAATGCIVSGCGTDTALNKVLPATKKLCSGSSSGSGDSSGDASAPKQPTVSGSATVIPPPPASTGTTPSPVPTAGAAVVSPLGGLAAFALVVLAL